jgi:Protein of unknown function, DUF547
MRHFLLLLLLSISLPSFSFDHTHAIYDQVLDTVVTEKGPQTFVDYDLLHKNPSDLNNYLATLEGVSEKEFDGWNKNNQMAFLINAYNAFTLKLILNNYPDIESIRDLGGFFFNSPWDIEFFTLLGEKTNLDHIEHGILRVKYNEPRIHFAVNCASKGCPALQKKAFVGDILDEQLENAAIQFLRDPERNRFNKEKNLLEISSIFKWFAGDFTKNGSVQNYVSPYISDDPDIQALLKDKSSSGGIGGALNRNSVNVRYLEYDWSLNKK